MAPEPSGAAGLRRSRWGRRPHKDGVVGRSPARSAGCPRDIYHPDPPVTEGLHVPWSKRPPSADNADIGAPDPTRPMSSPTMASVVGLIGTASRARSRHSSVDAHSLACASTNAPPELPGFEGASLDQFSTSRLPAGSDRPSASRHRVTSGRPSGCRSPRRAARPAGGRHLPARPGEDRCTTFTTARSDRVVPDRRLRKRLRARRQSRPSRASSPRRRGQK